MLLRFFDLVVYGGLGLPHGSRWAETLHFFLYDSVKILFLLYGFITGVGVLRTFLPRAALKAWMGRQGGLGNLVAAVFGAVTPFCSCSSIPLFFGFLKAGVPLGTTFSFLITSPLINEYLVVLMLGFFGWKITVLYVASGLLMGTLAGMVLGRLNLEKDLAEDMAGEETSDEGGKTLLSWIERARFGHREAVSILKKLWGWILVGVGIGALIHNYVPQEMIQGFISKMGIFSVPIAVVLGVPMYGSCAAIVPIAVVLFQKGLPLGTALAFMMAISALSLPEAVMLRRAMNLRLIAIFFGVTAAAIVVTGYLFNFLQGILL